MHRINRLQSAHKSLLVPLSLATVLSVFSGKADAQNLVCNEPLVFGEIITCGGAGSITIRTDNTTTSSCVTMGSAPTSRAVCRVFQSPPFNPVQINVDAASITLTNGGGGTMTVNDFNILTNAGGTQATIDNNSPLAVFPIGATVNVGGTQAAGSYTGTMGVTAVFQ